MFRPLAMRSKTCLAPTARLSRMISLTRPCGIPVAVAMRVWLSPVYWRSRRNSAPMSRLVRAWATDGRAQNSAGIAGGSNALVRMTSLGPRRSVEVHAAIGSLQPYITVRSPYVMGSRLRVADRGRMRKVDSPSDGRCPACRGRGWKFRRARRALVIGTLTRGAAAPVRRTCLTCGGSGKVDTAVPS